MVPKSLHGICSEITKHLGSWHFWRIFRATKIMMVFFSSRCESPGLNGLFIVIASIAKGLGNGWTCHGHDLDIKKTNLMAIHGFFSWEKMQCWGLNSHYFHIIGDKLINLIGFYIPMIHVIKGGMSLSPIQGILRKTRKLIYGTSMPMFFRCEPLMATRNPVITYQLTWKISRYFTTGLSTIPGGWPGEFLNHQQYVGFLGVHPDVRSPI